MDMDDMAAQAKHAEEAAAEEEVVVTWPLIFAVLVAVVLQFLVGYNIGVMVSRLFVGSRGVGIVD